MLQSLCPQFSYEYERRPLIFTLLLQFYSSDKRNINEVAMFPS